MSIVNQYNMVLEQWNVKISLFAWKLEGNRRHAIT